MAQDKAQHTKIAVFTGAGASKPFQIPLTGELLPEIRRLLKNNQLFGRSDDRAVKFRSILRRFFRGIYPGFDAVPDEHLSLL